MNKTEFIKELKERLYWLDDLEFNERISFYLEAVDDRIEEGASEEEAVKMLGSIDDIVVEISKDSHIITIVKDKIFKKRNLKPLEIFLLILGSPIWLSLMIAIFAVAVSLCAVAVSLIISLWAVFISFIVSSVAGIVVSIIFITLKKFTSGLALFSCCLVLLGLSIFAYYICKLSSKGAISLVNKMVLKIKSCLVKEERNV